MRLLPGFAMKLMVASMRAISVAAIIVSAFAAMTCCWSAVAIERAADEQEAAQPAIALRVAAAKATKTSPADERKNSASPIIVKVKRKPTDAKWMELPARTLDDLPSPAVPAIDAEALSRFGGWKARQAKATGFFRAEKIGPRWWIIDPEGYHFVSVGVNGVRGEGTETVRAAMKEKFGSAERWAAFETKRLREHGFNSLGCWSDVALLRAVAQPLPYCPEGVVVLADGGTAGHASNGQAARTKGGFMRTFGAKLGVARQGSGHALYPNECMPIFHPKFAEFCDEHARPLAALKDDPYLLGYFTDNELPMPKLDNFLALDPSDEKMGSSQRAARQWLDARRGAGAAPTDADRDAWIEHAYDRYFAVVAKAIRKYDLNHMIFGSRFYGAEKRKPEAFRAAGRYCDVIGVNLYGVWQPKPEEIGRWTEWSGRPVIITEWYAKGMDGGYANNSGAGWTVPTQRDRGLFYQTFTLGLLESPNCVGWHWFRYMDNDPTNTAADPSNRDSNKGIVTIRFEPYEPLLEWMRPLNRRVYPLAERFTGR